jgi:hypothetical protein
VPQTILLSTDRIYIEFWAQKNVNQSRQVSFHFGTNTPSHVHTTLPSISGTGFVTVTNGIFDSTATTLPLMVGATSLADGVSGLVTKPLIADRNLFLRGDAAWATLVASGTIASGEARRLALYPSLGTGLDDTLDAGNTRIVIAAHATGRQYTIDNVGAAASFVMTQGDQTIAGIKTLTSPSITTSLVTSSTTFALVNTTATTLNIGGAATTFALGGTATTALTATLFGNLTSSGVTKVINIGTAGANGSITNINIGSATSGATGTTTFSSTVNTFAGATSFTTGIVSTTSARNTLGTALNLRNLYNNSETRTYSGMTIVNGVGGYVELTLTAVTTLAAGTLVRLGNITGTNLGTTTDYYVYASTGGTTLRLAATYANALASTPITTATGPYSGGNATLTLHASAGTGTSLAFITGTASTPTSFPGSAIDSVLTSYGGSSAQPVFDLVFRTSTGGGGAAERLRVNATSTSVTGGLIVSGTLSGVSGSTLTIGGGSTTLPSATITGGSFLSFGFTTYPSPADYLPTYTGVTNSFSLGTKISLHSNNAAFSAIGVSGAAAAGGLGIGGDTAIWFANTGIYQGVPYPTSCYHFYNFPGTVSADFDGGQGFRKGYPFFRIVSNPYHLNASGYNEIILAVSRASYNINNITYGSVTNIVQNGANIDITFTIATAGAIPSQFEVVTFGKVNTVLVVNPANFIGSGRVLSVTAPTTNVGDSVTVSIAGTLPSGTYVSGAVLMSNKNISSARISFETGAIFTTGTASSSPFYPVTPALSYETGVAASTFSNRGGWHLFSHTGVTADIHMCSYSPLINFATLQTAASEINIGTGGTTSTFTKTINIGTGAGPGSTTAITIGSTFGTVNTIIRGNLTLGTSGGTLGFFGSGGNTRQTALTTAIATITPPTYTLDNAIQGVTSTLPFGFVNANEGNTLINVVANLQARVNDLETKLRAYNLLA